VQNKTNIAPPRIRTEKKQKTKKKEEEVAAEA
jgi:hypothetical protein